MLLLSLFVETGQLPGTGLTQADKTRAVRAATVTTVLTVALFYGKVIIIQVHNNNNDVIIKYSSMAR